MEINLFGATDTFENTLKDLHSLPSHLYHMTLKYSYDFETGIGSPEIQRVFRYSKDIYYISMPQFIYPFYFDEHLGCFQFLFIKNNVSITCDKP